MKRILAAVVLLAASLSVARAAGPVKIGFLVKSPENGWFQNEWKFADQAGKDLGFQVVKIGTPDGEKVVSAIDNLAAQGAQGLVICTQDVKLGTVRSRIHRGRAQLRTALEHRRPHRAVAERGGPA